MSPTKKSAEKKPAKSKDAKPAKAVAAKETARPAPEPAAAPAPATPAVELIDMVHLAQELRQPLLQVRKMVQAGQIPGVKVEGEWRFNLQLVREAMLRRSRGY